MWGDFNEKELTNVGVWSRHWIPVIFRIKHLEHIGWGLVVKGGPANCDRISIRVILGWHTD
jgi:hypothetical protein